MKTFRELKELLAALKADLYLPNAVVAIDGVDGSGKSTLANDLAEMASWSVLHLDDYLHKDRGTYVQYIDTDRLKADIRSSTDVVLVEGVCVLDVLERVAKPPACHIYVKRLNRHGLWIDEDESRFDCSPEQKIAELSSQVALLTEHFARIEGESGTVDSKPGELTGFRAEVIRYHRVARPFEQADYIFERVENDL